MLAFFSKNIIDCTPRRHSIYQKRESGLPHYTFFISEAL